MKNQQLRELLTRIPASPETDELQNLCERIDGEFEQLKHDKRMFEAEVARAGERASHWKAQNDECVTYWQGRKQQWKVQLFMNRLLWGGCGSAVGVLLGWLFICYVLY